MVATIVPKKAIAGARVTLAGDALTRGNKATKDGNTHPMMAANRGASPCAFLTAGRLIIRRTMTRPKNRIVAN
jgi:hypothetical protein